MSLASQLRGSLLGLVVALLGGFVVYGLLRVTLGIRLSREEGLSGADLSIQRIGASSQD